MFPHGRTVTIIRPPGLDDYGKTLPGEPDRTDVEGCAWAPRVGGPGTSSTEIVGRGRQGVVEGLTLYAPVGTDILHTDQVELPGEGVFAVEGEVGTWWNPHTGTEDGIEVALRRTAG